MNGSLCLLSILLLACTTLGRFPEHLRIYVRDVVAAREMMSTPITIEDKVEVEYTHSIFGVQQKEIFSVDIRKNFLLEKVIFGSIAAALYFHSDPGRDLVFEDNAWVLKGNKQIYPVLKYRVSPGTGHLLKVGNRTFSLSGESSESGRLIEISLEKKDPI